MEPPYLEHALKFATTLGIGLLIGLERERHPESKAGLRTFALITVAGTLFALLGEKTSSPWILAAGLLVVASMLIAAYHRTSELNADPGTTTIAAAMVSYGLGATVWY